MGFTGGVNLADEYINHIEKYGRWKDAAVMLEGEACPLADRAVFADVEHPAGAGV